MSPIRVFDPFALSLGISFVPVSRESKKPYHLDWANPEKSFPIDTFKPDDNVGGRWGVASDGVVDVDCDTEAACRISTEVISEGPRYGRASNYASHYLIRSPGAKTKQFVHPVTKKMIIELRSTGSQSVLAGSIHKGTGELYEWERQEPPRLIEPHILLPAIAEIAACALLASFWTGSRHRFALLLSGYFAKHQVPQERAIKLVTLIVIGARDEELSNRLEAVNDTYTRYANGEDIDATLTEVLGDQTSVVMRTVAEWLDVDVDRYRLSDEAALLSRPAAPFLVKNLLVQGSLVALVSPPDLGKTFLALDLALSIASGQPKWLGEQLNRHGAVVFVIGEGSGRFKLRHLAWKQTRGIHQSLPFFWRGEAVPLLEPAATRAFLKHVAPLKPVAVVFDTLSRCLVGGDENSAKDMGMAVGACDELRSRTKALVMLLHHTRKDGLVERGSSALRGAVDTILTLQESTERGLLTLECERQKDAEPFAPMTLRRKVIQLDDVYDDDGRAESSCVIQLATAEEVMGAAATLDEQIIQCVRREPGITKTKIVGVLNKRQKDVYDAVGDLLVRQVLVGKAKGNATCLFLSGTIEVDQKIPT